MTENQPWKSPYPAILREVRLVAHPRSATLLLDAKEGSLEIELTRPSSVAELCDSIEDCFELRIADRNSEEGGQLEYGRYRVEVWDEDNRLCQLLFDEYELRTV